MLSFRLMLYSCVVERRDCHKFGFHFLAHVQCLYKVVNALSGHLRIGTRQRFQCFVWVWVCLSTEYGLNGFCHYCPRIFQVGIQSFLIQDELTEPLQRTLNRDDTVSEWHTDVAQYGRVGEVALQTAYG